MLRGRFIRLKSGEWAICLLAAFFVSRVTSFQSLRASELAA